MSPALVFVAVWFACGVLAGLIIFADTVRTWRRNFRSPYPYGSDAVLMVAMMAATGPVGLVLAIVVWINGLDADQD